MKSLLTRFEVRRTPSIILVLLLWVLLHFVFILQFNNLCWADSLPPDYAPVLACAVFLCCLAEGVLLGLLAGLAKGRALRRFIFIVPVYLYFLLICVSWALFKFGIGFLDADILRAFLVDTTAILRHFSALELLIAALALLGPLFPVLLFLMLSPTYARLRNARPAAISFLVLAALSFVMLRLVPSRFGPAEQRAFRAAISHGVLPSLGLFWSPLLIPVHEPTAPNLQAELTPRYSLEEYQRRLALPRHRPDIFVVIVEALRSDMVNESVDGQYVMPNLRKLAQTGTLLDSVYAQSTESAYSMTSIVTGLYPMKFGVRDTFVNLGYPHERVYDVLSAGGYRAGFFSSANENWQNMANLTNSTHLDPFFHSESDPASAVVMGALDDAFSHAVNQGMLKTGKLDDAVTVRRFIDWLKSSREDKPQKPLFAVLSLQASHFPYQQGVNIPAVFAPSELTAEERAQTSFLGYPPKLAPKMKNRYRNSLRYIDGLLGEIVTFLQSSEQFKDSILLVTGDHGELFHDHDLVTHGSSLFNLTMSVPVVLYHPEGSLRIAAPQHRLIDLAPTIVDLAGLPPYENFQGQSLVSGTREEPVFSSLEGLVMQDAVIFRGMKLIFDRRAETYSLYDVQSDFGEKNKLPVDDSPRVLCLKELLASFRARQLTYFRAFDLYSKYFPPHHGTLPPACQ
ncbi:MAG: sulfatase-like hydrolase/transferase [Deltaproteobacteria bacterium]|nr:sulfatase-like hydrolase/transferase [Deltaproteobacteria bacterium]